MAREKPSKDIVPAGSDPPVEEPLQPKGSLSPDSAAANPAFPVVGIGASAGGLDAFKKFFAAMPATSGMAFVVVPHLDPTHKSLMVELLARQTAMPVREATHGQKVEPNAVYIIPPAHHLSIDNGHLELTTPDIGRGMPSAIDFFFRTLAADQQERAIGIVLSGTGNQGTQGLKEIKAAGGMVMVQEPDSAEYAQMPSSAIATGIADYVLPPAEMPAALIKFAKLPYLRGAAADASPARAQQLLEPVLSLLRNRTKYDFRGYRKNTLLRRVQRRMGLCHLSDPDDYLQLLRDKAEEVTALFKDLLIGVTAFFREPEPFEFLQQHIIPELIKRANDDTPVRVWVPGCATGEEAYSLAMLFLEGFAAANKTPNLQIFATDRDEDALQVARLGVYLDGISVEVSPERLLRFFLRPDENHYQANKQLRESVVFAPQNLITDAPFSKLDLISCRNLLIYLEPEVQQKVMGLFHFALREGGYLMLGPSESVGREPDLFEPISKKGRIFRRIGPPRRDLVEFPIMVGKHRPLQFPYREPAAAAPPGFTQLMQKVLLADFTPAAALINRKFEILCVQGPLANYLEFPPGQLTKDLLAMARQGLRVKLRAAVQQALRDNRAVIDDEARVKRDSKYIPCTITVKPIHEPKEAAGLVLVTLVDRAGIPATPQSAQQADAEGKSASRLTSEDAEESAVVRQLDYELNNLREELQGTVEEYESANEELKAAHEEVMSVNEELQSSNEELETSKEELQSLNEELTTVNSQLQDKVEELERANSDIQNLLASSEITTVFLDTDLRIRWFTPSTAKLLNLLAMDIGRPITDFAPTFRDNTLLADCRAVLDKLAPIEKEVWTNVESHLPTNGTLGNAEQSDNLFSRCYLRRILPYLTAKNHIDGVVITLVDITSLIASEAQARRLAAVLKDSNDAVNLVDIEGRIIAWNRGAAQMYGYSEAEALQLNIRDLFPREKANEATDLLQRIIRGEAIESMETQRRTKDGRLLHTWLTVTRLLDPAGNLQAFAKTERDITARKEYVAELKSLNEQLEAIVKTAADAIITIGERGDIRTFNPAAEKMFGVRTEEAIGQNVKMLMPAPYQDEHDTYVARYLQTGEARIIGIGRELVGRRKDGSTFPVEIVVSEVQHGSERAFTGIIRDISERKQLQADVLNIVNEEDIRIGQELHDSVQQQLTGLGLIAQNLADTLSSEDVQVDGGTVRQEWAKRAGRVAQGISKVLNELHVLARGLIPVEVDSGGLVSALIELASTTSQLTVPAPQQPGDSQREAFPIQCTFTSLEPIEVADNNVATHLFRIAQEAVTNAVKHGRGDRIEITLERVNHHLCLQVLDNGMGIEDKHLRRGASGPDDQRSLGLRTMAYRAGLIGAMLRVERAPERGTRVRCTLPM